MVTREVLEYSPLSFLRGFLVSGTVIGLAWCITITSSFLVTYWPPLMFVGLFLIVGRITLSQWDERRMGLGLMTGALVGGLMSLTLTWAWMYQAEERCGEEAMGQAELGCATD